MQIAAVPVRDSSLPDAGDADSAADNDAAPDAQQASDERLAAIDAELQPNEAALVKVGSCDFQAPALLWRASSIGKPMFSQVLCNQKSVDALSHGVCLGPQALLLRASYGGMQGDQAMLRRFAALWEDRYGASHRLFDTNHGQLYQPTC